MYPDLAPDPDPTPDPTPFFIDFKDAKLAHSYIIFSQKKFLGAKILL
jgi:hypothetical protein